ncbi:potassium voltage-gated channel protein Shaw-like [Tubulanus polymorphus]|uniref:potassium voltage-gated channel protein Shaw-like n=1 Tax=Tubulanus polymorphus TaxID=672921 RepID=UPI003DA371CD
MWPKDIIHLNIGGRSFTTCFSTLRTISNTRLSELRRDDQNYDLATNTFYFDRSAVYFEVILDSYRTGELHVPACACVERFELELKYWAIPMRFMPACCRRKFIENDSFRETVKDLQTELHVDFQDEENRMENLTPFKKFLRRAWLTLEYPDYSPLAKIYAICVGIFAVLSVLIMAVYFHPAGRTDPLPREADFGFHNAIPYMTPPNVSLIPTYPINPKKMMITTTKPLRWLFYFDVVINLVLSVDILMRLLLSPAKLQFMKSVLNWLDLLASSSYWIYIIIMNTVKSLTLADDEAEYYYTVNFLVFIIVLRVFRILRLSNIFKSLKIFMIVMKKNICELFTLLLFLVIGMIIFSLLIFQAELDNMVSFPDIFSAFWWSIITMTTVGYGDMLPISKSGYVIGSVCAVTGILLCGLVIPIISNNFAVYYSYARACKEVMNDTKDTLCPMGLHQPTQQGQLRQDDDRNKERV